MRSDAYITVTCDGCGVEEQIQITATARGYDDRNVAGELRCQGWITDGDADYCNACKGERIADGLLAESEERNG